MTNVQESKLKKIKGLLVTSTVPKEITSSIKTAYTKLGKRLNLKRVHRSSGVDKDEKDISSGPKTETRPKQVDSPEKAPTCNHYPGYLAQRGSKTCIPDDCMTCKDLMECMRKVF